VADGVPAEENAGALDAPLPVRLRLGHGSGD